MKRLLLLIALILPAAAGEVLRDIPYVRGGTGQQKLDIYLPDHAAEGRHPVVIAIHGGGWKLGNRSMPRFVQPKTRWLNREGFIVVSIGYRLTPEVRHPAHIQDVCAAIAWVQKNIARHHGDPDQLYLLGHSAGAHLAALAGTDFDRLQKAGADPAAIRGVILLDGAGYDIPGELAGEMSFPALRQMYLDAFTADPKVQRDASPIHHADHRCPPFLLLHVTTRADSTLQSQRLAAALEKHGGFAKVVAVPGKTHGTISRDLGKRGDPVTRAVAAFLGLDP
ncbi:alpha/beta hydrolase [Haloferula sargassicola]|uniref:Acetyl esterase n=1 Tax=Haloferula sargassicola TaxID=490096 RepID=A0ABP9URI1_9BACT